MTTDTYRRRALALVEQCRHWRARWRVQRAGDTAVDEAVKLVDEHRRRAERAEAERDALHRQLRKWEEWKPDDETLAAAQQQARDKDGGYDSTLAAQGAYIMQLEHHLRGAEAERDALRKLLTDARAVLDATARGLAVNAYGRTISTTVLLAEIDDALADAAKGA